MEIETDTKGSYTRKPHIFVKYNLIIFNNHLRENLSLKYIIVFCLHYNNVYENIININNKLRTDLAFGWLDRKSFNYVLPLFVHDS